MSHYRGREEIPNDNIFNLLCSNEFIPTIYMQEKKKYTVENYFFTQITATFVPSYTFVESECILNVLETGWVEGWF